MLTTDVQLFSRLRFKVQEADSRLADVAGPELDGLDLCPLSRQELRAYTKQKGGERRSHVFDPLTDSTSKIVNGAVILACPAGDKLAS